MHRYCTAAYRCLQTLPLLPGPQIPVRLAHRLRVGLEGLVLAVADVAPARAPPVVAIIPLRVNSLCYMRFKNAHQLQSVPVAPAGDGPVDEGLKVLLRQPAAPPQRLVLVHGVWYIACYMER